MLLTSDGQAIEKLSFTDELREERIPDSVPFFAPSESVGIPDEYQAVPSP